MTGAATAEETKTTACVSVLAGIAEDLAAIDLSSFSPPHMTKRRYFKTVGPADDATRRAYALGTKIFLDARASVTQDFGDILSRFGDFIDNPEESAADERMEAFTKEVKGRTSNQKLLRERHCLVSHLVNLEAVRQFPELAGHKVFIDEDWNIGYDDIPSGLNGVLEVELVEIIAQPKRTGGLFGLFR